MNHEPVESELHYFIYLLNFVEVSSQILSFPFSIVHEEDFSREIMWISDHLQLDGRHFFRVKSWSLLLCRTLCLNLNDDQAC